MLLLFAGMRTAASDGGGGGLVDDELRCCKFVTNFCDFRVINCPGDEGRENERTIQLLYIVSCEIPMNVPVSEAPIWDESIPSKVCKSQNGISGSLLQLVFFIVQLSGINK